MSELTTRQCGLLSQRADRAVRVRLEIVEYLSRRPEGRAWRRDLKNFVMSDPGTFYAVVNLMLADHELERTTEASGRVYFRLTEAGHR